MTAVRDKLVLDIVVQNKDRSGQYACVYIGTSDSRKHIDDDLGNEYSGGEVAIDQNMDNEIAPNQRKRITMTLPKPRAEAATANFHFEFRATNGNTYSCNDITDRQGINFHIYAFDLSPLK
jgi:hypothetical protein